MTAKPEDFDEAWTNIVSGWLTVTDFDDVTDRIEALAALMKRTGIELVDLDELQRATAKMMVERQVCIGVREGHFDDVWGFRP